MNDYTTLMLLSKECADQAKITRTLEDNCVHDDDKQRARLRSCLWTDASQILGRAAHRSLRSEPLDDAPMTGT